MEKNAIIVYDYKLNSYSSNLWRILEKIRLLDKIYKEFLSGDWDSHIKYRTSYDKGLMELQPKLYQDRGKWVDFIFNTEYESSGNLGLAFTAETLYSARMRLILLFFYLLSYLIFILFLLLLTLVFLFYFSLIIYITINLGIL